LKKKIGIIALTGALVLGIAGPASAVPLAKWSERHYAFTEGLYSYQYSNETRIDTTAIKDTCYDYHIQRLGGIGFGKKVWTGYHECG